VTQDQASKQFFTDDQHKELETLAAKVRDRALWFLADCKCNRNYSDDHDREELHNDAIAIEQMATDLRRKLESFMPAAQEKQGGE
jgi:hypothetical protein